MIRAIVDGNVKVGWYVYACETNFKAEIYWQHQLHIPHAHGFMEVFMFSDVAGMAEATGKLDKNGDEIYGSRGDMQGGDRVAIRGERDLTPVCWNVHELTWMLGRDGKLLNLSCWLPDELEIIKGAE